MGLRSTSAKAIILISNYTIYIRIHSFEEIIAMWTFENFKSFMISALFNYRIRIITIRCAIDEGFDLKKQSYVNAEQMALYYLRPVFWTWSSGF